MTLVREQTALRTASLTAVALVAFAANSLLCRLALGEEQIDAASYTSLRLFSGAATLWIILAFSGLSNRAKEGGSWVSAAMLLLYAAAPRSVPLYSTVAAMVSITDLADREPTALADEPTS